MIMHDEWADKLSEYLDGELDEGERTEIAAHLQTCPACADLLASLESIASQAAALPPKPPDSDLWDGIASRLAEPPARTRRVTFTLPALVAAGVVLAILSGWIAVRFVMPFSARHSATVSQTMPAARPANDADAVAAAGLADAQYDAAVADLQRAVEEGRGRLDAATIQVVEQNLAVIDQAVEEAQRALDADPANADLSGYLLETRRHKLDLLRRAAALASESN